jgi:hypothetical protein
MSKLFGTRFSLIKKLVQNLIVKSDKWLNLIPENGTSGMPKGVKLSPEARANMSQPRSAEHRANMSQPRSAEHRAKISEALKLRVWSVETRAKIGDFHRGKVMSEEARLKMSASHKGVQMPIEKRTKISETSKGRLKETIVCPHCLKVGGIPAMKRWHFDNCKSL